MDMILEKIPGPDVDSAARCRCWSPRWIGPITSGRIAIGRVQSGTLRKGQSVR